MSTELTIQNEMGQSLAEMIGVSGGGNSGPTLARIFQLHTPVMGEVEVNGKKLKTEVLGVGTYKIDIPDQDPVFASEVELRVFAIRQQWQRWNSEANMMQKTVMANNLNGDLKDNTGGFNLGRPSGYIKDFNALPDSTKELIRSVNRVKIFMGMLTVKNPLDANGEPTGEEIVEIPFVMDVKNRDSMKSLDDTLGMFARRNVLPIMHTLVLGSDTRSLPNGSNYGIMVAKPGQKVDLKETDNESLKNFMDYIGYVNNYIMTKWDEAHVEGISDEDADLVGQLVNVEGDDE